MKTIQNAFFRIMPLFRLRLFIPYEAPHGQLLKKKQSHCHNLSHKSQLLTILRKKTFENIVGKGENADYQHFLLFPQCFLFYQGKILSFWPPMLPTIYTNIVVC